MPDDTKDPIPHEALRIAITSLRQIAQPALGGKQQQWIARLALAEIEALSTEAETGSTQKES